MIYVAEILDMKFIKIGFTENSEVEKRMAMLQTGNPFKINCILAVEGTLIQEKELHRTLADTFARIMIPMPPNEWYPGRHPVIKQFVEEMKHGVNNALAYLDKYNQTVKQPGRGKTSLECMMQWPEVREIFPKNNRSITGMKYANKSTIKAVRYF